MSVQISVLTPDFAVSPQIAVEDIREIAAAGFKSIVINRPDFEGGLDQPTSSDVIAAASAAGIKAEYLPVISGAMTREDVVQFAALLRVLPAPVLAYCRSGTRSTNLYQAAAGL
ncbi:MAG: TIGR01244 family phosphatase [Candidimonas sp.]|nr:MAG: TIGR01244 family phosphatase [Candidimonas sp.]